MSSTVAGASGSQTSILAPVSMSRRARVVRVELMDGAVIDVNVERKCNGSELLDRVCDELEVTEKDYFGLQHEEGERRTWVDLNRRLSKTFRNEPWEVRFAVKFYPPEPSELHDDMTRYQLKLAVQRDISEGRLPCSEVTLCLLSSYLLQAELGDLEGCPLPPRAALPPHHFLTPQREKDVLQLYKKHSGQSPAEADLNYLENAKKLPLYGVELHPAQDSDGVDISIGVCAAAVCVYRDKMLMNRFPWAKVLKLSYKARVFTVRLRASDCDQFELRVCFRCPSPAAAKTLWRAAVEHHIFFRRTEPVSVPRLPSLPRLGSRRTSCRATLHQIRAASLSCHHNARAILA